MTQLTYNEAFDPYHAIFRVLRLAQSCSCDASMSFDLLRILDFYLLFPFRIQGISLFAGDIEWRGISKSYQWMAPYGGMPGDPIVFNRMEPFQRAAISSLVKSGHVGLEKWEQDEVKFENKSLPEFLVSRITDENDRMKDITQILCDMRDRYPLLGKNGLKDRTNLMEYRYDPV